MTTETTQTAEGHFPPWNEADETRTTGEPADTPPATIKLYEEWNAARTALLARLKEVADNPEIAEARREGDLEHCERVPVDDLFWVSLTVFSEAAATFPDEHPDDTRMAAADYRDDVQSDALNNMIEAVSLGNGLRPLPTNGTSSAARKKGFGPARISAASGRSATRAEQSTLIL